MPNPNTPDSEKPQVVSPGRQPIFPIEPDLPEILQHVPQSLLTDTVTMVRRGIASEKFIVENGETQAAIDQATAVIRLSADSAKFLRAYVRRLIAKRLPMKAEMGAMALLAIQEYGTDGHEYEEAKLAAVPAIVEIAGVIRSYMSRGITKAVTPASEQAAQESSEPVKPKVTVAGELVHLSKLLAHEEASLLAKAVLEDEPENRDKYLKRLAAARNHERGERRGEIKADPELVHAVYNAAPSSVLYATCAKAISIRAKSAETADRTRLADAQTAIRAYERAMSVQDENLPRVTPSCTKDIATLKTLVAQLEASIAKADKAREKKNESK